MEIFGQLVRTAVNTALLPVAVVQDVLTLGGVCTDRESYTVEAVQRLKDEASPRPDEHLVRRVIDELRRD